MQANKTCNGITKDKAGYITTKDAVPDNSIENIPHNTTLSSFDTYWVGNLENNGEERNTKQGINFARLCI